MGPSPPQNTTSHRLPRGKRRRMILACDTCRARKSRCDGARPRCDYLVLLEKRLKAVESSLTSIATNDPKFKGRARRVDEEEDAVEAFRRFTQRRRREHPMRGPVGDELDDAGSPTDLVDAADVVAEGDDEDEFSVSARGLIRHTQEAVTWRSQPEILPSDFSQFPASPSDSTASSYDDESEAKTPKYLFPPPGDETWAVIDGYLSNPGSMFSLADIFGDFRRLGKAYYDLNPASAVLAIQNDGLTENTIELS